MFGRIDAIMAAGEHGDCAAFNARAMRSLVDAAREPRDDDKAGLAEFASELAGELQPCAGGVARADDRDNRPHQGFCVAPYGEQRWRVVERRQPCRIAVLAGCEPGDAELAARGQLGLRLVRATDAPGSRRTTPPREIRQPLQRRTRGAEMIDQ